MHHCVLGTGASVLRLAEPFVLHHGVFDFCTFPGHSLCSAWTNEPNCLQSRRMCAPFSDPSFKLTSPNFVLVPPGEP